MQQLLILEDDIALGKGIQLALQQQSLHITLCRTLAEARKACEETAFDLMLLDVNLPDGNGLAFLTEMRKMSRRPIILLTANDMEMDIVTGLELGADDYITKPFSLAVLRARVNTQLRRIADDASSGIQIDAFHFDFERMEFTKQGRQIELSKTEQKLLRVLVNNRGNTVTRADLVDRIWTDGAEYVDENALSVTMKRLRNKLEDNPSKPAYLKTIYGLGYAWEVK